MKRTVLVGVMALVAACSGAPPKAPVVDRTISASEPSEASRSGLNAPKTPATKPARPAATRTKADWRPDTYVVKRGDTLHAIALDHGLDYRELGAWNNLNDPNRISIGQKLALRSPPGWQPNPVVAKPLESQASVNGEPLPEEPLSTTSDTTLTKAETPTTRDKVDVAPKTVAVEKTVGFDPAKWQWPAQGQMAIAYDGVRSKGVAIAGKLGDAVLASNAGKVVYVGKAIKTYGQLIIIKHDEEFLTVYAHNAAILVKEGQRVNGGQKIAEMGEKSANQVALHFEIRKLGRPVDPAKYLPAR